MPFLLQFEHLRVDLAAGLAGNGVAAHLFEVLDKFLGAEVGVVLAVGHRMVGHGVVDGDARVLNKKGVTSNLSIDIIIGLNYQIESILQMNCL